MLNDDSLGRALDALWAAGLTQVFAHVAAQALEHFGLLSRFVPVDTSSFHVHGAYEGHPQKEGVIRITHGYLRDHRPDLKQVVVGLLTTYRTALPVWIQALDGHAADVKSIPQRVQAYVDQLRAGEDTPYIVADSALYSEENLHILSTVKWITRVPERIARVWEVKAAMAAAEMRPSPLEGYRYTELGSLYGGVRQRWLVVYSQAAYERVRRAIAPPLECVGAGLGAIRLCGPACSEPLTTFSETQAFPQSACRPECRSRSNLHPSLANG